MVSASETEGLDRVVLAISTYRAVDPVVALLRAHFGEGSSPFHSVMVVDSLGDGQLAATIAAEGWPVRYENAERNLGSAGNLRRRIELASIAGARWCYAINHDGHVDCAAVTAMVRAGESAHRVGAVYPNRFRINRGGSWEAPRRGQAPRLLGARLERPVSGSQEVAWSSSNGALYNLEAFAEGIDVWSDLWMGWEDLAYGLCLKEAGWRQIICEDAVFTDTYEYGEIKFLGKSFYVSDKPYWYAYYNARNLILIARRIRGTLRFALTGVVPVIAKDFLVTLAHRRDRRQRLRLLFHGLRDGLRNVAGKGQLP